MNALPPAVARSMGTFAERAEHVLEDVVFRFCMGVGIFIGAAVIARYLLTPEREKLPEAAPRQLDSRAVN